MKSFFFVKLLIILSIICVCLLLTVKINENFEFFDSPDSNSIKLSIESGSEKEFIVLKWKSLRTKKDIDALKPVNFVIIFYKNSQGPYLIPIPTKFKPDIDKHNGFITHTFETAMNVEYKFAVVEKIFDRITEINKYVKVKRAPPGLDIKYVNDSRAKVVCKADGSYEIIHSKKCRNDELPVIAKFRDDEGNIKSFGEGINDMKSGYDDHQTLMRELTYSPKIKLNFM